MATMKRAIVHGPRGKSHLQKRRENIYHLAHRHASIGSKHPRRNIADRIWWKRAKKAYKFHRLRTKKVKQ